MWRRLSPQLRPSNPPPRRRRLRSRPLLAGVGPGTLPPKKSHLHHPLERLKAMFQLDSPISRIVSVSASSHGPVWRDLDTVCSANTGKGDSDGGALDSVPLFIRQLVAGGVSGGIAKSTVAPLECVKILFQIQGVNRDTSSQLNDQQSVPASEVHGEYCTGFTKCWRWRSIWGRAR